MLKHLTVLVLVIVAIATIDVVLAQPIDVITKPIAALAAQLTQNTTVAITAITNATTGFSEDTARRFLYHAYAAYCPTAALKSWKCKFCKGGVTLIDTVYQQKTNTFVFIAYDSQFHEVVVSYRGTNPTSIKNWVEDLKFWKADTDFAGLAGAKVAKGFFECQQALQPGVLAAIRTGMSQYPGARLVVTGHSLGGAMGHLAALDLKVRSGQAVSEVFTFGSPRVGNPGFSNQYSAHLSGTNTWRVVNHRDIVPHLPPHAFNFQHEVQEIWEKGKTYKTDCVGPEDSKCSAGVILPILPDSILDHLHYMEIEGGLCLSSEGIEISNDLSREDPSHAVP